MDAKTKNLKKEWHQRYDSSFCCSCPFCAIGQTPRSVGATCGYCGAQIRIIQPDETGYDRAYFSLDTPNAHQAELVIEHHGRE